MSEREQRRGGLARLTATSAAAARHNRAWVAALFALASILLVPWAVLLAAVLPSTHRSAHWDVAWVGFDALLALVLLVVAVTAWRRSPWLEGAATAAAALLFVDAWFDALTASSRSELAAALVEATLVELPLALLCLLLARRAKRRLATPDAAAAAMELPAAAGRDGDGSAAGPTHRAA